MSKLSSHILCGLKKNQPPTYDEEGKEVKNQLPSPNRDIASAEPRLSTQVLAACLACWINLASGACLGYATPALPKLQKGTSYLQITEQEGSWMASLLMLGALAGGFLAGPCISLGRRRALWLTSIPTIVSWILIAMATNSWFLFGAHIMMGICLGITTDASQLYVSETAYTKWRGALGCIPILMFNVGILTCYTAGAWLNWDELAIFGCVLSLPALFFPIMLPETPSYLVARGCSDDALRALKWLRGSDYDVTAEYEELQHCEKGPGLLERIKGLRERDILRPLLLISAIRALSRFCGLRAILCYTQSIFISSQSSLDVELSVVATGVVQLLATLVACGLLDRLGRRKLLIGSQAVMGMCLIGLGCYLYYSNDVDNRNGSLMGWLPVIAILIYIIANSIGLGPVSGIIIGELVPQRHKSIVSSITGSVSWLSAFIITKTFLDLRSCLHLHGAIWAYGSVCIVGVIFVYIFLPETRGLSQYEIEVLFKEKMDSIDEPLETRKIETLSDIVVVQHEQQTHPSIKNAIKVNGI
ncbi:Facilitated trehalose transporter Tret1-2 homolog [Gryllus bimaculatus]|nr:Facilitated trehalose transporter Tret1-2 homolog [Gryllus bimaculatus]